VREPGPTKELMLEKDVLGGARRLAEERWDRDVREVLGWTRAPESLRARIQAMLAVEARSGA
jgi:hypothetical protein